MRTCILCLPRSGSQYCERLISSLDTEVTSLGEYFEGWNDSNYGLNDENNLCLQEFISADDPFSIHRKYKERVELLSHADKHQNFTLRLFLLSHYDFDEIKYIITRLKELGFRFVFLQRNFRDIAISYSIARNSTTPIFTPNSVLEDKVHIDIDKTRFIINLLYDSYTKIEGTVDKLNISYDKVIYTDLQSNIEQLFEQAPTYIGTKTLINDPSYYVVNSDEFLNFINEYD